MSITKDFESTAWKESAGYFLPGPVMELLAHTRGLEAMLKKHEWADTDDFGDRYCPECQSVKLGYGHYKSCPLAKLLEGVE